MGFSSRFGAFAGFKKDKNPETPVEEIEETKEIEKEEDVIIEENENIDNETINIEEENIEENNNDLEEVKDEDFNEPTLYDEDESENNEEQNLDNIQENSNPQPVHFSKMLKNRHLAKETDDYTKIKNIIKQNLSKVVTGSIDEVYSLTSEVLLEAPEDFFDKILEVSKKVILFVQDNLSRSDKAGLIARLKENPTDTELRKSAFNYINTEYLKYDSSTPDLEYKALDKIEKVLVLAMTVNEICGLGPLEPLYRDHQIREIICNGPYDVQVEIKGKVVRVPSCKFSDPQHLQDLITKLYSSVNKDITRTNPFERARLKDNSRVFAVHTSIAPDGPNLNIRRHTDDWISPDQLIDWGSMPPEMAEWIGAHINAGCSFIVNGGTSTGKTTLLAALTGYLPNDKRIITIEKNIELKPAKGKLLAAAMECIPRKNNSSGFEVTMRDLVECTTQMRPDIIICGEVVADEAYDLVQAGNTGHQVASTIHSNTSQDCINRLMSLISQSDLIKGKDAYELISSSLDIIITVERFPQDGSRRITDISEVGVQTELGTNGAFLPVYPLWVFEPDEQNSSLGEKVTGKWVRKNELSSHRRKKIGLDYIKMKNLDELRELY